MIRVARRLPILEVSTVITTATRTILYVVEAGAAPDQVERCLAAPDQFRQVAATRGRRVVGLIIEALGRWCRKK